MSERLDPEALFALIAAAVPRDLKANLLVVGSLAAAYRHREQIHRRAVNTKDADILIHPAGAVSECRETAERLLRDGWRPRDGCEPRLKPTPVDELAVIRLYPPDNDAFFLELLAFPGAEQAEFKRWIPVQLAGGWYGLPSFRFMSLCAEGAQLSPHGILHAAPEMMALSNLLSHRALGSARMGTPIGGRSLLRSAKDLGRVLALAWLATREETEAWPVRWNAALAARFPAGRHDLAHHAGDGLRALLADRDALEEARIAVDVGLLNNFAVTTDQLRTTGESLLLDAIDPLAELSRASP